VPASAQARHAVRAAPQAGRRAPDEPPAVQVPALVELPGVLPEPDGPLAALALGRVGLPDEPVHQVWLLQVWLLQVWLLQVWLLQVWLLQVWLLRGAQTHLGAQQARRWGGLPDAPRRFPAVPERVDSARAARQGVRPDPQPGAGRLPGWLGGHG